MKPYVTWTSPDGLVAVEVDEDGCWLRKREHPADQWGPPEEMLLAGGRGKVTIIGANGA